MARTKRFNWKSAALFSLILIIFTASLLPPQEIKALPPTTIGPSIISSTNSSTISKTSNRNVWSAQSLIWVFYRDSSNTLGWRTSSTGLAESWSNFTSTGSTVTSDLEWATTHNSTKIAFAFADGNTLKWRQGTMNPNGTITWDSTLKTAVGSNSPHYPEMAYDSAGYAWITYESPCSALCKGIAIRNQWTNGSWTTYITHDIQGSLNNVFNAVPVTLSSQQMYFVWSDGYDVDTVWYNGAWQIENPAFLVGSSVNQWSISAVARGNDVIATTLSGGVIYENNRCTEYPATTWCNAQTVTAMSAGLTFSPVISYGTNSSFLSIFFGNSSTGFIYYSQAHYAPNTVSAWTPAKEWISANFITGSNTFTVSDVSEPINGSDYFLVTYVGDGNNWFAGIYDIYAFSCSFTSAPSEPLVNQTVTFTGTTDNSFSPTYHWTFGDSSSGTGNPKTHAYNTTGYFTVLLNVTDIYGGECLTSSAILIPPIPITIPLRLMIGLIGFILLFAGLMLPHKQYESGGFSGFFTGVWLDFIMGIFGIAFILYFLFG